MLGPPEGERRRVAPPQHPLTRADAIGQFRADLNPILGGGRDGGRAGSFGEALGCWGRWGESNAWIVAAVAGEGQAYGTRGSTETLVLGL